MNKKPKPVRRRGATQKPIVRRDIDEVGSITLKEQNKIFDKYLKDNYVEAVKLGQKIKKRHKTSKATLKKLKQLAIQELEDRRRFDKAFRDALKKDESK